MSSLNICKESLRFEDLNASIYLLHEALLERQHPHPMRIYSLADLASSLVNRFAYLDIAEDLDQAISLIRWDLIFMNAGGSNDTCQFDVRDTLSLTEIPSY